MLGQASLEDGPNSIIPFMQGMLQHLLLKEILYPPLKEVVDKYPEWLEEKKASISSNDLQRLTKQLELLRQVSNDLINHKKFTFCWNPKINKNNNIDLSIRFSRLRYAPNSKRKKTATRKKLKKNGPIR